MSKGDRIPTERKATRGFHGTDYDFEGFVLPRKVVGHAHYAISGEHDTYFLPADGPNAASNEAGSWNWTRPDYSPDQGNHRQRVHITRPIGVQHMDNNLQGRLPESTEKLKESAAVVPAQEILDTRWAPPATEGVSHVSQTLPHVNWNQFNAPNWTTTIGPVNGHPGATFDQHSPRDVKYQIRTREYYNPQQAYDRGFGADPDAVHKSQPKKEIRGQQKLF